MNPSIRSGKRETILFTNHKDDEKLLSESLYRNLHVIQRFENATSDFLTIYVQQMFIKPNPKAFLHVFHLIFSCLDAAEFNKRFVWPIYDKTNESQFRISTLDYINHLNIKHQLGLETLKLHNIHIPGGLKFIKIVHKFSVLAMKVILARNEKSISNVTVIPDTNQQLAKLEKTIDEGLDFVARFQVQSNLVLERTDEMKRMIVSFFEGSTINVKKEQCWRCLNDQWRNQLNHAVENNVKPKLERVAVVSKLAADIEQLLTKFFADREENFIEYEKGKLVIAQNVLMKWSPDLERAIAGMMQKNLINFENLLQVFQFLLPRIMEKIGKFEFRGLEALEYESQQIDILDARISCVQEQFSNFENRIQPFLKNKEKRFKKFCMNLPDLPFTIMKTPIVNRNTDNPRRRFALMDESLHSMKLLNESLPCSSRTINKHQNVNTTTAIGSTECSSSMQSNKSRNDAMRLLLKNKKSTGNVTQTFSNISRLSKVCAPKFSSTMCLTAVKNYENRYIGDELTMSSLVPNTQPTRALPKNVVENLTILSPNVQRKFPFNSAHHLNRTDVRGSPTSLWQFTENIANAHQSLLVPAPVNGNCHSDQDEAKIENVVTALAHIYFEDDEFLGNVSDSVLNNVTN